MGAVAFSSGLRVEIEADFDDCLVQARLVRVGDWHSHPSDDPDPSDADLRAWSRHSDDADVLPYVGVVVTPGELGWTMSRFYGWVTREDQACSSTSPAGSPRADRPWRPNQWRFAYSPNSPKSRAIHGSSPTTSASWPGWSA